MSQKLIARPPPPAFLFPIYNVKDPVGFRRPHCFSPVAGGGGYLVAGLFGVNRSFPTFSPRHPDWILAQKPLRAAEGLPS